MKVQEKLGVTILCFAFTACDHRPPEKPTDKALLEAVDSFEAIPAGSSAIRAYARDPDGLPLAGCDANFCKEERGIFMVIASRPRSSPESHAVKDHEKGQFTYFHAIDGSISPYGLIRYAPAKNDPIWIEKSYGDGPPIDSMIANFNLPSGKSVRYLYKASSEDDHVRVFNAAKAYLGKVGIN